ncbi:MAG: hypothetical protein NTU58_01475 [Candidatus Nealsonbacteria bacterium]|nr:hypothetical protein [Candidatus Nealsonbacteria bacterium]
MKEVEKVESLKIKNPAMGAKILFDMGRADQLEKGMLIDEILALFIQSKLKEEIKNTIQELHEKGLIRFRSGNIILTSEGYDLIQEEQRKADEEMKRRTKKIGLSVSRCVADICMGNVKIEDVSKIIGGTACKDEEDWNGAIDLYKRSIWSEFPEKAEEAIRKMIAEKRIEQPRLERKPHPNIKYGIWVTDEKEILWKP